MLPVWNWAFHLFGLLCLDPGSKEMVSPIFSTRWLPMGISFIRQTVCLESVLWLLHQCRLSRGLAAKYDAHLWSRQNFGAFDSSTVCFAFASLYI